MSLFLFLIGSPGRAVKSPNGPVWGLNEPWSLGSPGTLLGLALSALTECEKCRALGAGLAPSQSQHWGTKGVAPSCSVLWPALPALNQEPGLASLRQHFPPDSGKDPGELRGKRAGPWAVPQFPAGPREAPADQGLPRRFAWIPNIQGPFELSARDDDWSRIHLFQLRCTLQLPWTHVLVEILSSCPICAACWSHLVASQGLRATAQRLSTGRPRAALLSAGRLVERSWLRPACWMGSITGKETVFQAVTAVFMFGGRDKLFVPHSGT